MNVGVSCGVDGATGVTEECRAIESINFSQLAESYIYQQRKTWSVPQSLRPPLLARPPSWPCLLCGMQCPDVENNDEGSIQIGSETFEGPNADVCDRS